LLERLREPTPAPLAPHDGQSILGNAVVVVCHQPRIAHDLAVGERDERPFGQRGLVLEPVLDPHRDRAREREVGIALVAGERVRGL